VYRTGTKRKFAAPANAPFAELPISSDNVQAQQPRSQQQVSKLQGPDAQQQQALATTGQKKKPRVEEG